MPLPEWSRIWLNSKSMLVVPLGSCTLCQNTFNKRSPVNVVSR